MGSNSEFQLYSRCLKNIFLFRYLNLLLLTTIKLQKNEKKLIPIHFCQTAIDFSEARFP